MWAVNKCIRLLHRCFLSGPKCEICHQNDLLPMVIPLKMAMRLCSSDKFPKKPSWIFRKIIHKHNKKHNMHETTCIDFMISEPSYYTWKCDSDYALKFQLISGLHPLKLQLQTQQPLKLNQVRLMSGFTAAPHSMSLHRPDEFGSLEVPDPR